MACFVSRINAYSNHCPCLKQKKKGEKGKEKAYLFLTKV